MEYYHASYIGSIVRVAEADAIHEGKMERIKYSADPLDSHIALTEGEFRSFWILSFHSRFLLQHKKGEKAQEGETHWNARFDLLSEKNGEFWK